jgi:hypothetical protein
VYRKNNGRKCRRSHCKHLAVTWKGGNEIRFREQRSVLAGIGIEAVDEKSERAEAMGGWKLIGLLITGKR